MSRARIAAPSKAARRTSWLWSSFCRRRIAGSARIERPDRRDQQAKDQGHERGPVILQRDETEHDKRTGGHEQPLSDPDAFLEPVGSAVQAEPHEHVAGTQVRHQDARDQRLAGVGRRARRRRGRSPPPEPMPCTGSGRSTVASHRCPTALPRRRPGAGRGSTAWPRRRRRRRRRRPRRATCIFGRRTRAPPPRPGTSPSATGSALAAPWAGSASQALHCRRRRPPRSSRESPGVAGSPVPRPADSTSARASLE